MKLSKRAWKWISRGHEAIQGNVDLEKASTGMKLTGIWEFLEVNCSGRPGSAGVE